MAQNDKQLSFRIFILITTPKLCEKATLLLNEAGIPVHFKLYGIGTAPSEMLDILGLGTPDKTIMISMMPTEIANALLKTVYMELTFGIPGNGIAFTMPLSGANSHTIKMLTSIEENDTTERKEEIIMSEIKRVLIAAVINQGYSEDVMKAAREAGAGGGTVIHARKDGNAETMSIWGFDIQEEKEIVLIVADTETKLDIMTSIGEKCGINTEANGMIVSLPIDSCIGIGSKK